MMNFSKKVYRSMNVLIKTRKPVIIGNGVHIECDGG
jgi:hypothetical protein